MVVNDVSKEFDNERDRESAWKKELRDNNNWIFVTD